MISGGGVPGSGQAAGLGEGRDQVPGMDGQASGWRERRRNKKVRGEKREGEREKDGRK